MSEDLILGVVIGLVVGIALSFLFKSLRDNGDEKLKALEEEHNKYRKQVDDHFINTAVLFKGLTDQYRDVYHHIANGAGELCSEEAQANQIQLDDTVLLNSSPEVPVTDGHVEEGDVPPQAAEADVDKTTSESSEETSETEDIPLAVEAEVPSELADEIKNQANKK
jgi:uncharacterized membrane-anchored protein YhcB (DUF1043 family)